MDELWTVTGTAITNAINNQVMTPIQTLFNNATVTTPVTAFDIVNLDHIQSAAAGNPREFVATLELSNLSEDLTTLNFEGSALDELGLIVPDDAVLSETVF